MKPEEFRKQCIRKMYKENWDIVIEGLENVIQTAVTTIEINEAFLHTARSRKLTATNKPLLPKLSKNTTTPSA